MINDIQASNESWNVTSASDLSLKYNILLFILQLCSEKFQVLYKSVIHRTLLLRLYEFLCVRNKYYLDHI